MSDSQCAETNHQHCPFPYERRLCAPEDVETELGRIKFEFHPEYRLGNRSALDWVIDQYQVSEDKRSGSKSDPNLEEDEQYIVRLVGQVVRVSVETVKIVKALPASFA